MLESGEPQRRGVAVAIAACGAGVLTAAFRFLATSEFNNDHFVHLTAAQQVLFGDWPTRDFIDIGRPLQIGVSALAQYVFGHTLFAEALVVAIAFGIAAALTTVVVFSLTQSLPISLGAVVIEVAAFPRTYSYPKLLVTAAGLWLIGYFLRRPGMWRQCGMAAGVATAFLFRHDLGLFVGVGGLMASVLALPEAGWRDRLSSTARFIVLALAMVAPYLIYVQSTAGVWKYFTTALEQNATEAGYVWPNPFVQGNAWDAQLLYVFHALPVVALALCAMDRKREEHHWRTAFLISLACVALAENFGLIRDVLRARIPDAIVPAVVLGAWLVYRTSQTGSRVLLAPVVAASIVVGLALGKAGSLGENLNRAGLTGEVWMAPQQWPVLFSERTEQLRDRFGGTPSRTAAALHPFLLYVDRCTTERHRLFLGGLIPEVAYLARRPFAGGGYEHYNFSSPANQLQFVERLRHQLVPFALIPGTSDSNELDADLAVLAAYLRERYVLLADLPVAGDERIRILLDRTLSFTSRDAETGWPCFAAGSP